MLCQQVAISTDCVSCCLHSHHSLKSLEAYFEKGVGEEAVLGRRVVICIYLQ